MADLPPSPPHFLTRKKKILEQLEVPDADYTDASPKGSVDAGIRELIAEINAHEGMVTTSSCAGRVSVFLEGEKGDANASATEEDEPSSRAASQKASFGGKGGGGKWLFVSHDSLPPLSGEVNTAAAGEHWMREFGIPDVDATAMAALHNSRDGAGRPRLIHLKFEPMILHILTASLAHAQLAVKCGLQAGFRESGAVNLTSSVSSVQPTPMVAIRSMGLGFESMIGIEHANGKRCCTVSPEYISALVALANGDFQENTRRIERFRAALKESSLPQVKLNKEGQLWEDTAARRERLRAEGLKRSAQLKQTQSPLDSAGNST